MTDSAPSPSTHPAAAAFFGHGSPMNALETNKYSSAWSEFGAARPRPKAILCVSAHWFTRGTGVTAMTSPRTIHDFGGFPPELFALQYPAPGAPDLANRVVELAGVASARRPGIEVSLDQKWGLDHGTWSVLVHVAPSADVPVVQLSIDATRPASWHWDLAERLAPLRDEGVMIVGSGNITHNFGELDVASTSVADWAIEFDEHIWAAVQSGDRAAIVEYESHPLGRRAAPTPDHFLPLVYIAALRRPGDVVSSIVEGIDLGSFSMRSFAFD